MKENFIGVIERFKKLKVLVIGDAILDTYIIATPEKFGREAPVPVFNVQEYKYQCGGAANTAVNVAALGAECYFLTVTGKDPGARSLSETLKQHGVHAEYLIKDKARNTIVKKRIIASSNILFRIDEGSTIAINEQCENELIQRLSELYPLIDMVIISDYECGVLTNAVIDAVKMMSEDHRVPVVVDAKTLSRFKILKPYAVKPNYEEAIKISGIEKITGVKRTEQMLQHEMELFAITGADKIAVTLDEDGVLLFEKGKPPYKISCTPTNSKNSIGAGDTFTSAFALALALNTEASEAAEIGAAAAAVIMQKEGTAECTNYELKNHFKSIPKYIATTEELASIITDLKRQHKKIVFTNGCFDLLHTGHIYLLNNARKEGDVLIVGVNSDSSIRKIKGNGRPINTLSDRMTVLAGLQSVDYLIAFDEESPVHLIKTVHPDVFIKGGNYTENSIPEAAVLKKIGSKVKIIPYMEEQSTTHIIDRIRDAKHEKEIEVEEY
jgi:D-beta-D-heptose 7-phosphate kinase/D-beta-D-heptose 1-phosphate adenosyltransferase